MNPPMRPELSARLSGTELRRWYWLRAELAGLARMLGISAGGSKVELTERLCAVLDGRPPPPATPRRAGGPQLDGALDDETVIPPGQRCSNPLREFFVSRVGPSFRFDGSMRDFIGSAAGRTLGDAVRHWQATRSAAQREIAPQFELNRFTRAWFEDHPQGTRAEAATAWREHRSLPAELRSAPEPMGRVHG